MAGGVYGHSEFSGGGPMPNGVFPKGREALTNGDRLRLGYSTGVEDDAKSFVKPHQFYGHPEITRQEFEQVMRQFEERERQLQRDEEQRYRRNRYGDDQIVV